MVCYHSWKRGKLFIMDYKKNRKQPKLSRDYLLRSTYRYLEKYATTTANLYFILNRKVNRILENKQDIEELRIQCQQWINEIVENCVKNQLVNDRIYATSRANSLLISGNSINIIKNKLRAKGVPHDILTDVIAEIHRQKPNVNIISAIKYVKKRRFGPFRLKEKHDKTQQKELSAMARAGFSYNDASKILNSSCEELEEILYDG